MTRWNIEIECKCILLKTIDNCADQAGWKKAQSGQYLCCLHATTSQRFYVLLAVECVWVSKLNKTIESVIIYTESTRRYN